MKPYQLFHVSAVVLIPQDHEYVYAAQVKGLYPLRASTVLVYDIVTKILFKE